MLRKIATTTLVLAFAAAAHAGDASPMHRHHGGMLEAADTDKDGTVTRDEFLAWRTQQFNHMDRNGDGVIDDADRQMTDQKREAMKARGEQMREKLDANGDGKITKDEFVNAPAPMFDKADTDGNGVLDAKELQAARDSMRTKWQEHRKQRTQAQ
ncbi:MAG TPA: EF-hand domain-containing protein [Steroidobacteraceae bacterium]|nr:EF-hand domain-containing protein [Steroidobacteraceae bacterium]